MGISDKGIDELFNLNSEEKINTDYLKTMLQVAGVSIKRTEPFGNEDCSCGSGNRYDMCCSPNKMDNLF